MAFDFHKTAAKAMNEVRRRDQLDSLGMNPASPVQSDQDLVDEAFSQGEHRGMAETGAGVEEHLAKTDITPFGGLTSWQGGGGYIYGYDPETQKVSIRTPEGGSINIGRDSNIWKAIEAEVSAGDVKEIKPTGGPGGHNLPERREIKA